jgi:Ricin-type beta-trefoil lectin domain
VRFLNRLTVLCGTLTLSAVVTATAGGVASADPLSQIRNDGDSECIAASLSGNAITQQLCGTTPGQRWGLIGNPFNGPVQIQNLDTGLCMNISSFSNGAPVVQVNCGEQRFTSFWTQTSLGIRDVFPLANVLRYSSPFANDCLDLENGQHDVGLPIQIWQCNPNTENQKWYVV